MTINVTGHSAGAPPSVDVAVSLAVGAVMSSVAVYRNDSSGRTLLRRQPVAGFDSRTVTDYECPPEESVTYDWEATYTTAFSTVFNEAWASLAAWTVDSGSWNVSGGKARNTATIAALRRAFASGRHRITLGSIENIQSVGSTDFWVFEAATADYAQDYLHVNYYASADQVQIEASIAGVGYYRSTSIDNAQPLTIDFLTDSISISGTGGSASIPASFDSQAVMLETNTAAANDARFGAVKVELYGSPSTVSETSAAVELTPVNAWLISPGTPSKSVPLTDDSTETAGVAQIAPVRARSTATIHPIMGTRLPNSTTTGPRASDETELLIRTATAAESDAMRVLLADDLPVLIHIPPSWGYDFRSPAFYLVRDSNAERLALVGAYKPRRWSLPLTEVRSPVVDLETASWTYAAELIENTTYPTSRVMFPTYADRTANNRS